MLCQGGRVLSRHAVAVVCRRAAGPSRRCYSDIKSSEPEVFDVVCVGGGPAGLALTTALSKSLHTDAHVKTY